MNVWKNQRLLVFAVVVVIPLAVRVPVRVLVMVVRNLGQAQPDVMVDRTNPRQQSGGGNDGQSGRAFWHYWLNNPCV